MRKFENFMKNLTRNCDALLTLNEGGMLRGFVITTLNKLSNV